MTVPLTTAFTAPASCATLTTSFSLIMMGPAPTKTLLEQARSDAPEECYPPSYRASATYAPGVCPSGWTTASSTVGSGPMTTAYCCPDK